jgi:hypothetical protein
MIRPEGVVERSDAATSASGGDQRESDTNEKRALLRADRNTCGAREELAWLASRRWKLPPAMQGAHGSGAETR